MTGSPPNSGDAPTDAASAHLDAFGLPGWTLRTEPSKPAPSISWTWRDGNGTAAGRLAGDPAAFALAGEGIGCALVSVADRSVRLYESDGADEATTVQWIADQVAPRILSHLGDFVLHAGAVLGKDRRAVLFLGASGQGKSTLTGFLHRAGWPLLGDDAARLSFQDGRAVTGALYRRLKLLPDSWDRLFPESGAAPLLTGRKVSVVLAEEPEPAALHPVSVSFRLDPPGASDRPQVRPLTGSETCLEFLRGSFALDPADPEQAGHRLRRAAALAMAVPSFALSYPRDYAQLERVRDLVAATLDGLDPTSNPV